MLLRHRPEAAIGVLASSRSGRSETVREVRRLCGELALEFRTDDAGLQRLGCREDCMVVGVFRKFAWRLDPAANHVVLDRPQYQGNVGTIMRTMVSFGFSNLAIIRPAADALAPGCVRASMGAAFAVASESFDRIEDYLEANDRTIYPFVSKGGRPVNRVDFRLPLSLLFGNEADGLAQAVCRRGPCVTIPHAAAIDSLNIAIAVGIALYEVHGRITDYHSPSRDR